MATRFLRLDLSANARDFETAAIEMGLPLLDKANANHHVLRRWLGRLIAEPEWDKKGTSVSLYVCDDEHARLDNVRCEPATADDLRRHRELALDFDELVKRLERIKPGPKEVKLHEAILRHFRKLTAEVGPKHRECHFFKYREAGVWRLVWGWGYQRKDLEPAPPAICTDPACALLFVRHTEGSGNCPACEAAAVRPGGKRRDDGERGPWLRRAVKYAAVALLGAVIGVAVYWWLTRGDGKTGGPPSQPGLYATPAEWTGPVGAQVRFDVLERKADGAEATVTARVVAIAEDPKVVLMDAVGATARARATGKTVVHFYLGQQQTHATLEVEPPTNPAQIVLDPDEITLGIGTTAQVRVVGQYADGRKVDLTDVAEWEPPAGDTVYCCQGQLEGKAAGETRVVAKYRATPSDAYLPAEAKVKVIDEKYQSLELAIQPTAIMEATAGEVTAQVVGEGGQKRSVWNSSLLKLQIDGQPADLAKVEGRYLRGLKKGEGTLKAVFRDLPASQSFEVHANTEGIFEARPKQLQLAVGEVAPVQVISAATDPVRLSSSDPSVVEVLPERRLVGRAPGKAKVTVSQEARAADVDVEVRLDEVKAIAFVPARVSVPVDGSSPLRLIGQGAGGQIELAPDRIVWKDLPNAAYAELDLKTLEVRGRQPTGATPQRLTAGYGSLEAAAEVDVVAPSVQVELTPAGPLLLPVGMTAQLHAWARYGDGRRVEIAPERLQWKLDPAGVQGIELQEQSGTVRATEPGAGPISVLARYQGSDSSPVEVRSTDAPFALELQADRALIVVNDAGQLRVTSPQGTAQDLGLEGAQFESSDPKVLEVQKDSGHYRALAPGKVTVTATHPKAQAPAKREFQVADEANLEWRPAEVKLPVGGRRTLELYRSAHGQEEKLGLVGGAGPTIAIGQPQAVQWNPPVLTGAAPAAPFELTAAYAGLTARATVEVLQPPPPGQATIRVVPAAASLAPGQTISPRVEQQASGEAWVEVDPAKVKWTVPQSVVWTPPRDGLRPQVTPATAAQGPIELGAEYAEANALLTITVQSEPPPSGPLAVLREPEGEELPVGSRQRYAIVVRTGDRHEPAAGVQWQSPFENDYVIWDPPVLAAKRAGHEQRLTATVGQQSIAWTTRTVRPATPPPLPPPRQDKPSAVRILSPQQPPITIPVGARFDDFRVEAVFSDHTTSDVTGQATLLIECADAQQAPVCVQGGRLCGDRPGSAVVRAEYNGVRSADGLNVRVEQVTPTAVQIEPRSLEMQSEESITLRLNGFVGSGSERTALGDIASQPGVEWKSDNPDVLQVDGPTLRPLKAGQAKVTAAVGEASDTIEVTVVEVPAGTPPEALVPTPPSLHLRVGETKWLGRDVTLRRGAIDLSSQLRATSSDDRIVQCRPNGALEGIGPGHAQIALTAGRHAARLPVVVELDPRADETGTILVEPATGTLAVGESQDLRVILRTASGQRIDRTGSAILDSANPGVLAVSGTRVTGVAAGRSDVSARLPGIDEPGSAAFTVVEGPPPAELSVVPSTLRLAVGEHGSFRVIGRGPGGRRDLTRHPDLRVTAGGDQPEAIQWQGAGDVRGVSAGRAALQVAWRNLTATPLPVTVYQAPPAELRIVPPEATINASENAPFVVFARRGDVERAVTAAQGLRWTITDPAVASLNGGQIRGEAPGRTTVSAELGPARAAARLEVVSPGTPSGPGPWGNWTGLRFIPDNRQVQLGLPGSSFRVVKSSEDGRVEDLAHRAEFTVADPTVARVDWTAHGPVITPLKVGRTNIHAFDKNENLRSRRPMLVEVVEEPRERPRLVVQPDPLSLAVGEAGGFSAVQILVGGGAPPVNVDYRTHSADARVAAVEGGKTLRGVSPGTARVTVTPVDVGPQLADLSADVSVNVGTPPGSGSQQAVQLVLTGPSRTVSGAEVRFRVERVSGNQRQDVTAQGAELVLDDDARVYAEALPGCTIRTRRPGAINLAARHEDLVSNPLPLRIDPMARFARLELEVARQPMAVAEARPYRLWGHPADGGPRQDLTTQVRPAGSPETGVPKVGVQVVEGGDIVDHAPPNLTAKAAGRFQVRASLGRDLRSDVVELEILPQPEGAKPIDLVMEPASLALNPGDRTGPIRVMARRRAGEEFQAVAASIASENQAVLAPDAQSPGQFLAKAPGRTRLRATFGGLEAFAEVAVSNLDPFRSVEVPPNWEPRAEGRFTVTVRVAGLAPPDAGLEYRVVTPGNPEEGQWKAATPDGDQVRVDLTSPALRLGTWDTVYNVIVQARSKDRRSVLQYPLRFLIGPRNQPGAGTQ